MTANFPWDLRDSQYPGLAPLAERLRFLVRCAVLAPSSHNTQPWKFRIQDERIDLFLDANRWLRVADGDQRELHVSVGCALESLTVAGRHFGFSHRIDYLPDRSNALHAATVSFSEHRQDRADDSLDLFAMLPVRHTNHGEYDGRPLDADVLEALRGCPSEAGITAWLTGEESIKRRLDELVVRADAIEFADPAFREELGYWIGQGVFGTSWLMSKIGKLAVTYLNLGASTAKRDSSVLMSSPMLGLIRSVDNERETQIRVGQVYQRLSLRAAAFGVWFQPMSQVLQVAEIRQEVAKLQPESGAFPQLPFRIGYAPAEQHRTPRRGLEEVLV